MYDEPLLLLVLTQQDKPILPETPSSASTWFHQASGVGLALRDSFSPLRSQQTSMLALFKPR